MATTTEKLHALRRWFVVYYLINLVIGTWASVVVVDAFRVSPLPTMGTMDYISGGVVIAFSLLVGAFIFVVALALFHQLLERKNWSRVINLIIAWLTALSAGVSLLSSPALFSPSGWLLRMLPEAQWSLIGLTSVATNVVSLAFAVYLIRTLQFDQEVRAEFTSVQAA